MTLNRLQIAQRMHALLLQEIDHAIEIDALLGDERYARDVLLVCDSLGQPELAALAVQFRAASARQGPLEMGEFGGLADALAAEPVFDPSGPASADPLPDMVTPAPPGSPWPDSEQSAPAPPAQRRWLDRLLRR